MNDRMILDVIDGNPGAANFIAEALSLAQDDPKFGQDCYIAIWRMWTLRITGSVAYIFWNDCCNRDTTAAIRVAARVPDRALKMHVFSIPHGIPFLDLDDYRKEN